MKWAHLDESYTWLVDTDSHPTTRKKFPDHFAYIPNDLAARLEAAWKEVDKVAKEVDKYAGKEPK